MSVRSTFTRLAARLFACFDRSGKIRARLQRTLLAPLILEQREAPSDAISSLHPIALLTRLGIDPLTIVAPVKLPEPPRTHADGAHLPPGPHEQHPSAAHPKPHAGSEPVKEHAPPHKGSAAAPDLSVADDSHHHPAAGRSAGIGAGGGGGGGGAGAAHQPPGTIADGSAAGGGHLPADSGDPSSSADSPSKAAPAKAVPAQQNRGAKSTHSSTTTSTAPGTPTVPGLDTILPNAGGRGGGSSHLPNGIGSKPGLSGSPGAAPGTSAPKADGQSPVSLSPAGSPARPISPTGLQLPAAVPGDRGTPTPGSPAHQPPVGRLPAAGLGNGPAALPGQSPGSQSQPQTGSLDPTTPAPPRGGSTLGPRVITPGPSSGGLVIHDAPAGRTEGGHYTITITESGSNTSDSFTLVETAVVDYDLSLEPTSSWTWDATVAFEYDFRRGTTTLTGTDGFTSTVTGASLPIIADGGTWGGAAEANDANPFSFGFYNYNAGHFSIAGQWTGFGWVETGSGYNSAVTAGPQTSSTTSAGEVTASDFSVWGSADYSTAFDYLLAGSQLSGQVSIGTYSLYASGTASGSAEAVGGVVTSPTTGGTGDSVSAGYEYQATNSGGYTVSQWGDAATAYYSTEDDASVSSFLHSTASAQFTTPSGTATVAGTAQYVADDWQDGTTTDVAGGSYVIASKTGSDTISSSASATAGSNSLLNVNYTGGGTGSYTDGESAGYQFTSTVRASDGYTVSGTGPAATASVTAASAGYTVWDAGSSSSDLSATFTGPGTDTVTLTWGLSLTDANGFSDLVTGLATGIGQDNVSESLSFAENGNYFYSLSVSSTVTNVSAATNGGTDDSTVSSTGYFKTSSDYSLSGTGHDSQWVTGSSAFSSADSTATLNGTGTDSDTQIANGRFLHTNSSATADNSSATFSYSSSNEDTYSYHVDSVSNLTPSTLTENDTYSETGTNSYGSNLSLSYTNQGSGTYQRGSGGTYDNSIFLYDLTSSSVGPGGSMNLVPDHETVSWISSDSGNDLVSGSASFVADPAVALSRWGDAFTDAYWFDDDSTGSVVDRIENSVNRSTETGDYSYSLSVTATTGVSDGNTGTDRTTQYAGGTDHYTAYQTAAVSQWVESSATLTRNADTATYWGGGGDTATTIQAGEKTHTSTTSDPTNWTESYSYTGSDTGTYSYSGGSNDLSDGSVTTYYAADSVSEGDDATFTWNKGGRTLGNHETDSFTAVESGGDHSRDQLFPTSTSSGTVTGEYTPYTGTAWGDDDYAYWLTITPDATAAPTSVSASYWEHETATNTGTYSGTVARGTYGDSQFHHDQETNWHSSSYTANEHGTPAPDAPASSGGTTSSGGSSSYGGGSSSYGGGSSGYGTGTTTGSSVPSTYTLTAHGGGQLTTVRTDDELFAGSASASLVTNSMTVVMTGDGNSSLSLTETYSDGQGWAAPFGTAPGPTVTIGGGASGTRSRTRTETDGYSLAASQQYLVSGTTVAAGTDTYWLHDADATAAHDAFTGSAAGSGVGGIFNESNAASYAQGAPSFTIAFTQADDASYTVDRVVTSGFSWSAGYPAGVAVDARAQAGTLAGNQSLSLASTPAVSFGPTLTRAPQMATLVNADGETRTGTLVIQTTYTGSPQPGGGTAAAISHTLSASQSWGTASVTLHADEYATITSGPSHTQTISELVDRHISDSHSANWSWESGVGGSAAGTATNTLVDNYQFGNGNAEVTVGMTYGAVAANSSHDETSTDSRQTYTVPVSLSTSTGAANRDLVVATDVGTGFETTSATGSNTYTGATKSGFDWHTDYGSQTYTVASTYGPTTTNSSKWMAGNDNHQTSASQTASDVGTMYGFQSQGSSTHTFTLATAGHHAIGATSTQDAIDNQDSASMSLWSSQTTSAWGAFYYDDVRFTASQLYTSSLSQVGAGADAVTSTLDASTSIAQAGDGADVGATNAWGTYTQTLTSTDTTHDVTTPIGSGASRTAGTTDHVSQNAFDIFYQPEAGTPKYTHSTTAAANHVTLTAVGTLTENLAGTLTEYLYLSTHKRNKVHWGTTYTSAWLDTAGVLHTSSYTPTEYPGYFDSDESSGADPDEVAWMTFVVDFTEAALDTFVTMAPLLLANAIVPGSGILYLLEVGYGVMGIKWGYDLGQALYALGTGTDPATGRELTKKEYASLVAGLLGSLAGAMLVDFAFRVTDVIGTRIQEVAAGERCGIFTACFAAGTPLRTPGGSRPIEEFKVGDLILSRDEHRPDGTVEAKVVEEVFVRTGQILHLHIGGQVIRTTPEHPFYAYNKGWVPAGTLAAGDRLLTEAGEWVPAEEAFDTGEYARVYNLRVADWHTYFVGAADWGFAAWAHNAECTVTELGNGKYEVTGPDGEKDVFDDRDAAHAFATAKGWTVREADPATGAHRGHEGIPSDKETPAAARTAVDAADEALAAGKLRGAAGQLDVNGRRFLDISGEKSDLDARVQEALASVPAKSRAPWHGKCAEVGCVDQAFKAGIDPAGGTSIAVNIGESGLGHGTFKEPCSSCRAMLKFLRVRF